MKVLSLFDGMACGALALRAAGIEIDRYVAYEIDKYAVKTSSHNFPFIEHKGDVFNGDFTEYKGFDLLCGGSPCSKWSIAQKNNRETEAGGIGWNWFQQYVRALREAEPKFFIYENNKSMSKAIRASITETFGFEPILINSALVSAQHRQRLYWVGKRNADGTYSKVDIEQPEDRGILLRDILEDGLCEKRKELHTIPCYVGEIPENNGTCKNGKQPSQQYRCYEINAKGVAVTTCAITNVVVPITEFIEWNEQGEPTKATSGIDGKTYTVYKVEDKQITIKGKQYPMKLADGYYIIRKLTVRECMRLQTVPEWYEFPVSDSAAYKLLGNGWTVEVITHILKSMSR